jgi:hypothetical protein
MRGFILTVVIAAGLFTLITQPHRFVSSSTVTITAAAASPTPEKHAQEGIDPMVTFGNAITSMVRVGAIDKSKFTKLYAGDENLLHNALMLLNEDSKRPVQVNQHNAGLILNMLWPLGISNQSDVLSKGPMGTTFKDRMNNMASTAGWILAVESGERYVNQLMLVPLRPDQQSMVVEISQHIYRPCCNNPTSFPDCNHGAAMLVGCAINSATIARTKMPCFSRLFDAWHIARHVAQTTRLHRIGCITKPFATAHLRKCAGFEFTLVSQTLSTAQYLDTR